MSRIGFSASLDRNPKKSSRVINHIISAIYVLRIELVSGSLQGLGDAG